MRLARAYTLLVLSWLIILSGGAGAANLPPPGAVDGPQGHALMVALGDKLVVLDVRTPEEWAEVGIPDLGPLHRRVVLAPLLTAAGPNPDFLTALADAGLTPGDSRPVLFVCKAGGRSVAAGANGETCSGKTLACSSRCRTPSASSPSSCSSVA